jgi:hypothetical protein
MFTKLRLQEAVVNGDAEELASWMTRDAVTFSLLALPKQFETITAQGKWPVKVSLSQVSDKQVNQKLLPVM